VPSNVDPRCQAAEGQGVNPDHPAACHAVVLDADQGLVDFHGRKKFAICGFASSSRHRMPMDDPAWVIMAMNQLYRHIPRLDVEWDIHGNWAQDNVEGTDHPWWLSQCGIPVIMIDRQASIPTSCRFPIERMIAKFTDYFTSTVAFMLAWTIDHIDREVQREMAAIPTNGGSLLDAGKAVQDRYGQYLIGIFGIDLIVGDEYFFQKACVENLISAASTRGIQVYLPPETALFKQRWRYGYTAEPESLIRITELQARRAQIKDKVDKLLLEMKTYDGALQEIEFELNIMDLRVKGGIVPFPGLPPG